MTTISSVRSSGWRLERYARSIILVFAVFSIHALAKETPVPVDQILTRPSVQLRSLDSMTVSPNGKWVAYVMMRRLKTTRPPTRYLRNGVPRDELGSQVEISPIASKEPTRALCPHATSCFRPSWSPDGRRIAFYSDQGGLLGLWEYDLQTGKARNLLEKNVKVSLRRGDEPVWSKDGKDILLMLRSSENLKAISRNPLEGDLKGAPLVLTSAKSTLNLKDDSEDWMNGPYREELKGSIVEVNRSSKHLHVVVPEGAAPPPSIFRLSPSGRWISYFSVGELRTRALVVVPRNGGRPRAIVTGLRRLSPDTNLRGYQWHSERDLLVYIQDGKLWTLDLSKESGAPRPLHAEIQDAFDFPLLFSAAGEELVIGRKAGTKSMDSEERPKSLAWVPLDEKTPTQEFPLRRKPIFWASY